MTAAATAAIFDKKHGIPAGLKATFAPIVNKLFAFLRDNDALDTNLHFRISEKRLVTINVGPLPFEFCLLSLAQNVWTTLPGGVSVVDTRWTSVVTGAATLEITFEVANHRRSGSDAFKSHRSAPTAPCQHVTVEQASTFDDALFSLFQTCWLSFEQEVFVENLDGFNAERTARKLGAQLFLTNVITVDADCMQAVIITKSMVDKLTQAAYKAGVTVQSLTLNGITRTVTFVLRLDNYKH